MYHTLEVISLCHKWPIFETAINKSMSLKLSWYKAPFDSNKTSWK